MAGKTFLFAGYNVDILTTLCLLLFVGAMGKSAQLGLHTWLPDAMEGPTPVSALIHAATMVTAGVFLVCRCSPLFEHAPVALDFVTFIGASTAFFAASVGLFQNDIKRVIAYSTCSQLGYMFVAAGVSAYGAAMFHLFTHAFFKALLFLAAGSVIHAMHHEQDMRKMGGLAKAIPFTWAMMLIGNLALTGVGFPILGIGRRVSIPRTPSSTRPILARHADRRLTPSSLTGRGGADDLVLFLAPVPDDVPWPISRRGCRAWRTITDMTTITLRHCRRCHESPLTMLVPLAVLAPARCICRRVSSTRFHRREVERRSGAALSRRLRDGQAGAGSECRSGSSWRRLSMTLIGFAIAYLLLHPQSRAAGANWRRKQGAALHVPLQQMVFRRAVRLPVCAPGHAARPLPVEDR